MMSLIEGLRRIRSFMVVVVTIAVVMPGAGNGISAQQPQPPSRGGSAVPIQFTGAAPGVSLELFMNAGKVATVTINSAGQGASVLDLSNLGKVQLQVYVDVCQDGKVVKVLVVSGQAPPEDDNCKRRIAGAAWWSDCGVTRITLDLTKFGVKVAGCGNFFTENKWIYPVAAGGIIAPFLSGGNDSTATGGTPVVVSVIQQPPVQQPPAQQQPAGPQPPAQQPPATQPPPPFTYTIVMMPPGVIHSATFSDLCFGFRTDPAQANQPFTATASGQGVVQPVVNGTTNTAGQGGGSMRIDQYAPYTITVAMVVNGVQQIATGSITVGPNAVACTLPAQ